MVGDTPSSQPPAAPEEQGVAIVIPPEIIDPTGALSADQLLQSLVRERDQLRQELIRSRSDNERFLRMVAESGSLLVQASVELEKRDVEIEKREAVQKVLLELLRTDPLTGLPNRVAFDEELESRAVTGKPFAVGKMDLTNFKAVNDRYGEDTGDNIIKGIADTVAAAVLLHTTRQGEDFVARIAGDTYAFIISLEPREGEGDKTPEEIVEIVGGRVLEHVENYSTIAALDQWGFTASLGIAIHHNETTEQTVKRADALMHEHKSRQHAELGAYRPSPN